MTALSNRFLGASKHPVDQKGRMSIAKRFQPALDRDGEDRMSGVLCVERRGDARCLWVFNAAGFDKEMETFNPGALDTDTDPDLDHSEQRDFFEFTTPFTLDNSGRLVIPQAFRDIVGIEGSAMAVGMHSRIEIWGAERWENRKRGARSPLAPKGTTSGSSSAASDSSSSAPGAAQRPGTTSAGSEAAPS